LPVYDITTDQITSQKRKYEPKTHAKASA
jgi:hypothetical protein